MCNLSLTTSIVGQNRQLGFKIGCLDVRLQLFLAMAAIKLLTLHQ
jgi:hypothetical protein